jgi:hypothetical protein
MDTDKIKAIVTKAKSLSRGEADANELMVSMTREMRRSPNMAIAIVEHLREGGLDLLSLTGEQAEAFRSQFKPRMDGLNTGQLAQIKGILARRWEEA